MEFSLNQGEDTEDWANYDVAVEEEEVSHSFNLKQNNTVLNQSKNYFVSNSYFFKLFSLRRSVSR